MEAHQAPPSLGFSRQEHWSGFPFPSPMQESEKWKWVSQSCPTLSDPLDCSLPGSFVHGIFPTRILEWGDAIYRNESATSIHVFPILNPPPSPYHPSGSSQCTSPKHPVSCIEPGLVITFLYDIIHVLMPFSQIIPPSLSHRVQKTVLSLSLLLSRIQGCHYHLSKFHIYALVYCIGVFLSGLLHSV